MLDIGWSELLVIGVVALIVVGPKDLPIMFRRMGEFTGKAKAMAREFTSAMNAAADEAGVKDIGKDLRKMANPKQTGLDAINKAAEDLSNWDDVDDRTNSKPKPAKPAATTAGAARMTPEREEAARKIRDHAETTAAARTARTDDAAAPPAEPAPAATGTDDRTQ